MSRPTKGSVLLYFDLVLRKVKVINTPFGFRTYFNTKEHYKWNSIDNLFRKLNLTKEVQKQIREVYHRLEKGSKQESIAFKQINNKKIVNFNVDFKSIDDNSDFIIQFN